MPELTVLSRVASIPLVATSLGTIHNTLSSNPYTRYPYATAQGFSKAALGYAEPLQKTIAPLIVRADGLANKGLDVVESRYPYPFKTPTEDIFKDLKGRSDQARDIANKTIDARVKTPAFTVAQGIDQVWFPCGSIAAMSKGPRRGSHLLSITLRSRSTKSILPPARPS